MTPRIPSPEGLAGAARAGPPTAPAFPKVLVVIPVQNGEVTIAQALHSVLTQDYPGRIEVVVADGSDTPATSEVIWRDYPGVRLVHNPKQQAAHGISVAM